MNNNGRTYLNSVTPFPGATDTDASYLVNLTHYTCGGRKICSLETFPITANLNYSIQGVAEVGKGLYDLTVLATGTVSYMPYNPGCPCNVCPVTEPIYAYINVPATSETGNSVAANETVCSLNGISCACNTSSSIDITTAFTLSTVAQG